MKRDARPTDSSGTTVSRLNTEIRQLKLWFKIAEILVIVPTAIALALAFNGMNVFEAQILMFKRWVNQPQ